MKNTGVQSIGIKLPIIREGDNLLITVGQAVLDAVHVGNDEHGACIFDLDDKDVIGITESIVARAQGNYVTIDDIVQFLREHSYPKYIGLYKPIFSRNRFAMILKAFARHCDRLVIYHDEFDDQGNPCNIPNPFTGVDIKKYYKQLCNSENCELEFESCYMFDNHNDGIFDMDARCHPEFGPSLLDVMRESVTRPDGTQSGYNEDYGLLGSNKATDEKLKLFPRKEEAQKLVEAIQREFYENLGVHVEVMVYGDGCFKDPVGGIWEFADPVVSPAYTKGLEGTPNEIKIKAFADDEFAGLEGKELENAIKEKIANKNKNLVGNMASQGTTPRRYVDLLGSLMDLTSGSGDKGTPVVLVKNYFSNYSK
jgi:hypothetical protein